MRTLRRDALEKIAALSATSTFATKQSDINKISRRCPGTRMRANGSAAPLPPSQSIALRMALSLPEIEALLALCKAAPMVESSEIAAQLLPQLTAYLPEAHEQNISVPFMAPGLDPAPWEPLTSQLAAAVLALGLNHPSMRQHAASTISRYLANWEDSATFLIAQLENDEYAEEPPSGIIARVVILAVSLLGFLEAVSKNARFWSSFERQNIIGTLRFALSQKYMIALETALSTIRNAKSHQVELKLWKQYTKRYATEGRPLGAMLLRQGFMQLVVSCAALQVAPADVLRERDVLEVLFVDESASAQQVRRFEDTSVESLVEIAAEEIRLLEDGSDYLQLGSAWQQRLAFSVKASALKCFLCCTILDPERADSDSLITWLEGTLNDPVQIADEDLAVVVFKSMAILAKGSNSVASAMGRTLPRIIVQGGLDPKTAVVAAECLASVLRKLPQDATITTLYSLGNVLSSSGGSVSDKASAPSPLFDASAMKQANGNSAIYEDNKHSGSMISLGATDGEEPSLVHLTTIEAIVCVAWNCKVNKIIALAISILIQKLGRLSIEVDAKIIVETAQLAAHSDPSDFRSLLKLYAKLCHDALVKENTAILDAIMKARLHISNSVKPSSELFEIYLMHLLDLVVSQGDAHDSDNKKVADVEMAAQEIAQTLQPLATLILVNVSPELEEQLARVEGFVNLQRDAWFNAVVHGFTLTSPLGRKHRKELLVLAEYSQPLVPEDRADRLESDIELNTTLRRGKSSDHAAEHRQHLIEALPSCEADLRAMNYSETVFLTAAYLVENLRASTGDCTKVLVYFLDPRLRSGSMGTCMLNVAQAAVKTYLSRTLAARSHFFSSPYVAQQLALVFAACCHRIKRVQEVAINCADLIIAQVPSALCQKSSLFALLELLSLMWSSCLDRETEEYEWRSSFASTRGNIKIQLSDNYAFRRSTLVGLHGWARKWMLFVMDSAPLDIKGLIQTYLSEYDDDGAYGHISLGRSFALEMGGTIPSTDQRLGGIESQPGLNINTASDFVAQYTTRQEYRFVGGVKDDDQEWVQPDFLPDPSVQHYSRLDKSLEDASMLLADMEDRTLNHRHVSIAEIRDVLRRAGALLCSTDKDQGAIVHHLVGIPFAVFTKQSIKLGISLWMGVIKENPLMESRILVEIAENWESTVRKRRGLFDRRLRHFDPFNVKHEFAPSDRELIQRRQHTANELIAPHLRLVQFLSSHFNATKLSSPHVQKVYQRLINVTLNALPDTKAHPLAREAHFHIVLLGLRILKSSVDMDKAVLWRFKDRVLSAALAWFAFPARWSYGGNRLQIKAEVHLITDVQVALDKIKAVGQATVGPLKSLLQKQELLSILLSAEASRLMVWLFPLENDARNPFNVAALSKAPTDTSLSLALKTAWAENPSIAVHMANRFESQLALEEIRFLLKSFPHKVLDEPDALEMLLGQSLPNDASFPLKYLLYWAPVNPMTAVTYFLPAYRNNPFLIQYAMRALESDSVDVTFFYVPQIVQALRYDVLGYVERYIIETAKFSQLFAHQIIWNMKANSFKDEESQIPDDIKPTLDKVMKNLVSSFSREDYAYFEREFAFFDEVTGISGKLKPFIKKSKPEKKQKIEEELRKIKLEIGVYLPSNPDGVVVGIDRKSGKPLQSHAKAPYMATFRIRKDVPIKSTDENEEQLHHALTNGKDHKMTQEIWQSAIFKVGDDCRQDVLALQLIAAFRGIFHVVGLDVYVNPYRVTATAPGCGVIDVLPNAISRDMLGREAVNGLYDYFVSKYGGEDSIRFQEARNNFVKSMAAYSVISWLLQFKDRHNGNIMIDDAGHILHIDFGFCFDIVPGGVRFERAPFKLTAEMVAVMGGPKAQAYQWFEELCTKAFLATRPFCEHLAHMVVVMLDSGLPCFKPQTIQHFKERFVMDKNEREAADFMKDLIRRSYNSVATRGYDHFQLLTNGIPY